MDERDLPERVAALEERVRRLEAQLRARPVAPAAPASAPAPPSAPAPSPAPAPAPSTAPRAPAPPAPAPVARAAAKPRDLESLLGANWLAKAGMLVLALGVVFFLKLAFDNGWIGLRARYFLGLAGGLALFALGDVLRTRRFDPAYPQVLAGGGAVIAYLTAYAGYAFDPLRVALGMTLPVTLLLLGLVSAALGAYAAWRNLPVLAATAVALSTILLAPAGDFSTAGVLYAAFLDTALLAAAAWRGWGSVGVVSLLGADLVLFLGLVQDVKPFLVAGVALVVNGLAVVASETSRSPERTVDRLNAGASTILLFLLLGASLADGIPRLEGEDAFGWSALGVGIAAAAGAVFAPRVRLALALTGGALLLLWPAIQFEGSLTQPVAWPALGAAGFGLALAFPRARDALHGASLAAGALALLSLFSLDDEIDLMEAHPVPALLLFLLVFVQGAGLWFLRRESPRAELRYAALALALGAPLMYFALALGGWGITVSWAVVALVAVGLGVAFRHRDLRLSAFAVFALVLGRVFLVDVQDLSLAGRVVVFLLVGALLLAGAFLYARQRPDNPGGTFRIFK